MPIHIMFQPDRLSAREMALEDVDVYVEEPSFLRALCLETHAVPRNAPMNVRAAWRAGTRSRCSALRKGVVVAGLYTHEGRRFHPPRCCGRI